MYQNQDLLSLIMTTKIHAAAFNFRGLPLEVRNEIYGYIVGKEYNFLWPGYRAEAYIGNVDDTAMAPVGRMDLVVLCVSKDMKAEAMPVLHLKGLLSYQIDFGYEKFGILHPSSQILTDNMRSIQLDYTWFSLWTIQLVQDMRATSGS
jgi:hypothetical protein